MSKFDIPEPFKSEKFEVFCEGISDNPSINVYINERRDFLFLHPKPVVDYDRYIPRVKKYSLTQYKEVLAVIRRRFDKIKHHLEDSPDSLLEIGAGDGSFLEVVRQNLPKTRLTAVDKDQNSIRSRLEHSDENYDDLEELLARNKFYGAICMFHVLEHILSPADFFTKIRQLMLPSSHLIIEVPSFSDPLLSLYESQAYSEFYFQSQHPYVYSASSLRRLLAHQGFQTIEMIHYQRYGLENHLNWLSRGRPGGNEVFRELFKDLEASYIAALEQGRKADTVIWVGKVNNA